jgi:hypothetical protein
LATRYLKAQPTSGGPYAAGLASNLAAAFWKLSAESEDADGDDCSGALASVGCLRAVATILESVSSLPHLYVQLEPAGGLHVSTFQLNLSRFGCTSPRPPV